MKKYIATAAMLSTFLFSTSSYAVVGRQGKVSKVELRADGRVNMDWGWGWRQICNVSQDVSVLNFPIKKEACSALYAQALTALTSGQLMTSYHSNSNSCSQAMAVTGDSMVTEQPYGYMIGQ
jgi:hypothetical protein